MKSGITNKQPVVIKIPVSDAVNGWVGTHSKCNRLRVWCSQIQNFDRPSINKIFIEQRFPHVSLSDTTRLTSNSTVDNSCIAWSSLIPLVNHWSCCRWDHRWCCVVVAGVVIAWASTGAFWLYIKMKTKLSDIKTNLTGTIFNIFVKCQGTVSHAF